MDTRDLKIPAMTPPEVHDYLRTVGKQWTGEGLAVELGCWLGASTVPLLDGLTDAGYSDFYWAFDNWHATKSEVQKAKEQGLVIKVGQDLMPLFLENTEEFGLIQPIKGSLPDTLGEYNGGPIEICLFDAPKKDPVFTKCLKQLEPHFLPGITVIGFLDYYAYEKHTGQKCYDLSIPVRTTENEADSFELMQHWPGLCSCAFFKYKKPMLWGKKR